MSTAILACRVRALTGGQLQVYDVDHQRFFLGLYQTSHGMLFTTRRSVISDDEKFEFVMSGLGSPPILH